MFRPRLAPARVQSLGLFAPAPAGFPLPLSFATAKQAPSRHDRRERRGILSVPRISLQGGGIPGFLTPAAVDLAWTQYQQMLLDKISAKVSQTTDETEVMKTLAIATSRDPDRADIFNYASMAHNNHFFFQKLSPNCEPIDKENPGAGFHPTTIPKSLESAIVHSFSSVESFKQSILGTANAMFGPGFVWLAKDNLSPKRLTLLCTYLSGSPYLQAHNKQQPTDTNTSAGHASGNADAAAAFELAGTLRTGAMTGSVLADLQPVLCVNTWEHVWLPDYGMYNSEYGSGKEIYLNNWFNVVDWNSVNADFQDSKRSSFQK